MRSFYSINLTHFPSRIGSHQTVFILLYLSGTALQHFPRRSDKLHDLWFRQLNWKASFSNVSTILRFPLSRGKYMERKGFPLKTGVEDARGRPSRVLLFPLRDAFVREEVSLAFDFCEVLNLSFFFYWEKKRKFFEQQGEILRLSSP